MSSQSCRVNLNRSFSLRIPSILPVRPIRAYQYFLAHVLYCAFSGISGFLCAFNTVQFFRWAEIYFDRRQLSGAHYEALKTMLLIAIMNACLGAAWAISRNYPPSSAIQSYVVFFWVLGPALNVVLIYAFNVFFVPWILRTEGVEGFKRRAVPVADSYVPHRVGEW